VNYWLFKSEPDVYSFERLRREGRTEWSGVRNYQARNFMAAMRVGDLGFFYHSSTGVPGIAGICKVTREAYPDCTAWEPEGEYHDPRSTPENPVWSMVDVSYERSLARFISLSELRAHPLLTGMLLLKRGSRLSVQPVTKREWDVINRLPAESPPETPAAPR
jgi:predicted RNA-binding protein with PUA-like domain